MGGAGRYRELWSHFENEVDAICWVIDSSDFLRMETAKKELDGMMAKLSTKSLPILFCSNKSDLATAATVDQISTALELPKLHNHSWTIIATNAIDGSGVNEALRWLTERVRL